MLKSSQGVTFVNSEKKDFDREAASWDANPGRVKLAGDIANFILGAIVLSPTMDVMDFGCGTGLLTLRLQSLVRHITGVDSSQRMLDVLNAKIDEHKFSNVRTLYIDLDRGDELTGSYDVIVSAMTLHHVKDVQPLLKQFYKIIAPAGHLCIADLDLDNGKFHENNEGVFHFGFDRSALREDFLEAGFDDVADSTAAEVIKPNARGEMNKFTVFLMTGTKRNTSGKTIG